MKLIAKYAVLLATLFVTTTSFATQSTTNTQFTSRQPLVGMPFTKVQLYKPVNTDIGENHTFVRWVNIIKASQNATINNKAKTKRNK